MIKGIMLHIDKSSAYRLHLTSAGQIRQRWLLLCGGTIYAVTSLWIGFRLGMPPEFAGASLALLPFSLALYGLTYARTPGPFLEINPSLIAAVVGAHIVLGTAEVPLAGGARYALLFVLLAIFAVTAAPTLRASLGALASVAATAAGGALVYLPQKGVGTASGFIAVEALAYLVPAMALILLAGLRLERERRAAFDLRMELERRATSDDLTGVSNRAHITLLAQNEFARARRYHEPYSCLMIEIDGYDALVNRSRQAANVVVQVFSGYCVVVMRHCDSFGRLSPARFLALLPETQGAGAFTLAGRMCRDLAALDVRVAGEAVNFTVSIGAAQLHTTDRWAGDLLRRVEQGLDDAIERGRGNAVFAEPPAPPPAYDEIAAQTADDMEYFVP